MIMEGFKAKQNYEREILSERNSYQLQLLE